MKKPGGGGAAVRPARYGEGHRRKQPFVWNAANITPKTRERQTGLFTAYGASAKIVYLETGWAELLCRNAGRRNSVPESFICNLLEKLSPPERWKAH